MPAALTSVRVDKWLWAARFFKTRGLAKKALLNGRIEINGERVKPSRMLVSGDLLRVQKEQEVFVLQVSEVSERRGPANIARTLYVETEASLAQRCKESEQRKLRYASSARDQGKPDKKQRRRLQDLKRSP